MWVCNFYNFGFSYHFDTEQEAQAYGRKSGFQFSVYKMTEKETV